MKALYNALTVLIILIIMGLVWLVQAHLFLNADVAWLLGMTRDVMQGAHYYTQYFETNPPLILYLNIPVILVHQFFATTLENASVLITLIYTAIALWLSAKLRLNRCALILTAVIVLFLAGGSFSEREHLSVIFIFPYIILLANRIDGKYLPTRATRLLIGCLAALGFAMKPYFILPIVVLFGTYFILSKNKRACFNTEHFSMLGTVVLYVLSILIFFPNYMSKMLHIIITYYTHYGWISFSGLARIHICSVVTMLLFVSLVFSLIKKNTLALLYTLTALCFGFIFFMEHAPWYYHLIPAVMFGALATATLLIDSLHPEKLVMLLMLMMMCIYYASVAVRMTDIPDSLKANPNNRVNVLSPYFISLDKNKRFIVFNANVSPYPSIAAKDNLIQVGPVSAYWILEGFRERKTAKKNLAYLKETEAALSQSIAHTLNTTKPSLALIKEGFSFKLLNKSPAFKAAFHHYCFKQTVSDTYVFYTRCKANVK